MTSVKQPNEPTRLRSQFWFDNPNNPGMTALYFERYLNFGLTQRDHDGGRPIIGIAQTGSDLSPCNRHHLQLAERVREGIRDAGGIALEFPCHPIQETGKRPTACLDRNLCLFQPGRGAVRLPARWRRTHHRLRQDHTGGADGGRHRQHSGHRALGRADARRLVERRTRGLRHDQMWKSSKQLAAGRLDYRRLYRRGSVLGAVDRGIAIPWARHRP